MMRGTNDIQYKWQPVDLRNCLVLRFTFLDETKWASDFLWANHRNNSFVSKMTGQEVFKKIFIFPCITELAKCIFYILLHFRNPSRALSQGCQKSDMLKIFSELKLFRIL